MYDFKKSPTNRVRIGSVPSLLLVESLLKFIVFSEMLLK